MFVKAICRLLLIGLVCLAHHSSADQCLETLKTLQTNDYESGFIPEQILKTWIESALKSAPNYKAKHLINQGINGFVYEAVDTKTGKSVALKYRNKLEKDSEEWAYEANLEKNFPLLTGIDKGINQDLKLVGDSKDPILVMPLIQGKNLEETWFSKKNQFL